MQVICEHPRIIIHPRLPELIALYHNYTFRGQYKYVIMPRHKDAFNYSDFSVRKNQIKHEDLDSCYVCDESTGEVYPMYIEVPCGHCDICKSQKVNSFVKRCEYETECYNSKPWFVTLTYNDEHYRKPAFGVPDNFIIPAGHCMKDYLKPIGGVSVRDAQLFLKRFRRSLERHGYKFGLRYVLVSEYGKNTHRGHYHAIFWNIPTYTTKEYLDVVDILKSSWNHGFVMCRLIDPTDDKGFYYTSKYLKKDCEVPFGCAPTFMLSSRGHGGIGAPFIDSIKDELRKTLNVKFKFKSKWKNCVQKLQFSRYLLNRVFPSFSKSVSKVFRDSIHDVIMYGRQLKYKYAKDIDYESITNQFGKFFYTYSDIPVPTCYVAKNLSNCQYFYDCAVEVYEKTKDKVDCELATRVAELRQRFLGKLFQYQYPIDIKMRAFTAHNQLSYSSIFEVL